MSEKNRDLIWIFVFLVALISVLLALTIWSGGGFMSGMMGMMGFGWGSMVLIPVVFLVLIALGAYYLITASAGTTKPTYNRGGRAFEIIKERYAKGEITREQFLRMKMELD